MDKPERTALFFGEAFVDAFGVHKIGNCLEQELSLRNHVGVKCHYVRRMGTFQSLIQVSGLGAFVVWAVEIMDSEFFGKFAHFRPAMVIAQVNVNLVLVGVFHILATDNGLAQKFGRFVISRNKDVHIGVVFGGNFGERVLAEFEHAAVVNHGFAKTENLDD